MPKLRMYQADAFTGRLFGGNPAAICPLVSWLPDDLMQSIALENNLAETAFFVPEADGFRLRWFTPASEVDLCGHATLATAHILYTELGYTRDRIDFYTRSGTLTVTRSGSQYTMNFPATVPTECPTPQLLIDALGLTPVKTYKAFDYLCLLDTEAQVAALKPNMNLLMDLDLRGLIVTAKGDSADFVSRFFAPALGIPEDPVTGSAHCELTPLWASWLNKTKLTAAQISSRHGELVCELKGDRVLMTGNATTYMSAEINLP